MSRSSRDLIKVLENDGWVLSHIRGSHHIYKKDGYTPVTVPHPRKDLPAGTYYAILKHAGIR